MDLSKPRTEAELKDLLRDLLARTEAAEARATDAEARNAELDQKVESLDKLNAALMKRVQSLTRRLSEARGRPEQLALELELNAVQRQLDELNRDKFGATSERRGRKEGKGAKKDKKPQTGHGPTPQPDLPREPQLHLLDEPDQVCPTCTPPRPLEPWEGKTADSEEVTVVERTFKIVVHQRQVYRCGGCGHVETALGPDRLIPGGRYSPEFALAVATDKYVNNQPLASQAREMANQGLRVTRQTLWDQLFALYVLLLPAYLKLQEQVLAAELIYVDETSWRLMKKGGTRRWWVWVATDGRRVFFSLAPTRGVAGARQLLCDYDGIVMADRYSVYQTLEKERTHNGGQQTQLQLEDGTPLLVGTPDYTLVSCWMHGRRGFHKADRLGEAQSQAALDLIGELYAIEAEAKEQVAHIADREERQRALVALRGPLRQARSRPIIDELRSWLDQVVAVPGLPLDKAVRWLDNGWAQLTRFVDDARIPLDNGLAERVIRGVVLGRKVYAGSRSERGTQVAALFYSLTQSCRLEGVDPSAFLNAAVRRALKDRDDVLLPEDFARLAVEG